MKVKKLGLVTSHLTVNQLSYQFISSANRLLVERDDVDISLFFVNDGPRIVKPSFSCMCLFEAYAYDGVTVATSLSTAARILDYPGPNRNPIYLYCMDLDYLRMQNRQYEALASVYMNPKIHLIARSKSHYDILSSVFKQPVGIVEGCEAKEFIELLWK